MSGGTRMTIVEKKPVPIYESTCPECKSVFRYKKADVSLGFIAYHGHEFFCADGERKEGEKDDG